MTRRPNFSIQPLEARRFLSASPAVVNDSPDVAEAREQLQQVTMELRHDRYQGRAELFELRSQVIEELRKLYAEKGDEVQAALAPLYKTLRNAIRAQGDARMGVLEELQDIREKWQPAIEADIKAVWDAKRAGDEDALADATKQIESDRSKLYAELNPLKAKLKQVTEDARGAITDAHTAIEDKLGEFSDTLKDLIAKHRAKQAEVHAELTADTEAVLAAREKLRQALKDAGESEADPALV
jgi:hypothetical protein